MWEDKSAVYTWSQGWSRWDDATLVPILHLKGWKTIYDGVMDLYSTRDKTAQVGYHNLNRPSPTATICKGLAQVLWVPVVLRAVYRVLGFVYYSIHGPSVGFTLYKHVESTNPHYLAGKACQAEEKYQDAYKHFMKGIEENDADSAVAIEQMLNGRIEIKLSKSDFEKQESVLKSSYKTNLEAKFVMLLCFKNNYDFAQGAFESYDQGEIELGRAGHAPTIARAFKLDEDYIHEYVETGKISLEKENPPEAAKIYLKLAYYCAFMENHAARKRLLAKAAALCDRTTIADVASEYYHAKDVLQVDPFIATLASYERADETLASQLDTEVMQALAHYYKETLHNDVKAAEYYWRTGQALDNPLSFDNSYNPQEAFQMYLKAAELGHVESLFKVGDSYQYGRYYQQINSNLAEEYFLKAANHNHADAMVSLVLILLEKQNLTETEIIQNNEACLKWLNKAASLANGMAYWFLAAAYMFGNFGLQRDLKQAYDCYQKGANLGNVRCMEELMEGYRDGVPGVLDQDPVKAKMWEERLNPRIDLDLEDEYSFGDSLERIPRLEFAFPATGNEDD